jgi:hypothetical protein
LVISDITRRSFILAASASVICAPTIFRAASLMPVHAVGPIGPHYYIDFSRFTPLMKEYWEMYAKPLIGVLVGELDYRPHDTVTCAATAKPLI